MSTPRNDDPLKHLAERIEHTKAKHATEYRKAPTPVGTAMKLGIDLVAGVCVGTFMGYWADDYLGTKPVFMLLGMCIGLASGVRLMMQSAQRMHDMEFAEEKEPPRDTDTRA